MIASVVVIIMAVPCEHHHYPLNAQSWKIFEVLYFDHHWRFSFAVVSLLFVLVIVTVIIVVVVEVVVVIVVVVVVVIVAVVVFVELVPDSMSTKLILSSYFFSSNSLAFWQ